MSKSLGEFELGNTVISNSATDGRTTRITSNASPAKTSTSTTAGGLPITATGETTLSSGDTGATASAIVARAIGVSSNSNTFTAVSAGLTQLLTSNGVTAQGVNTLVTAFGRIQKASGAGVISDPFTKTTAKRELELGKFTLGKQTLGKEEFLTTSTSLSTFGDGFSKSFDGDVTGVETETSKAESFSESFGGVAQPLSASRLLADSTSEALAEADDTLLTTGTLGAIRFLPDWTLNQKILGDTLDEVRNWNLIEITLRMRKEDVVEEVRPLTPGVGAVDIISTSDGGYEVVKRGGSNEVTLEAATERDDVRPVETWYLQNISEEVIGSEGQQYEVTIEALPVREKAFDNSLGNLTSPFPDETRTQGFWKYSFEKGSIVTRRVTTDIEREPTNELKSVTVSFLAEPEEVRVMEENLSKLNAVAERDVPDGTNIVEDSTSDKRHIVDVTPPQDARDTVEAGEYYVTEWETEYQQSRAYIVQMNLVENEN